MNKFILCAMEWNNKTKEELEENMYGARAASGHRQSTSKDAFAFYVARDALSLSLEKGSVSRCDKFLGSLDKYFKLSKEYEPDYWSHIQVQGRIKRNGAPKGNKNACKTEHKTERITITMTPEQKDSIRKLAGDVPLGPWALKQILG